MNIIEAIKSEKHYTRESVYPHAWFHPKVDTYAYSREELIAEDWIVKEQKLELSWERIQRAIALGTNPTAQIGDRIHDFAKIKKDLGFEE